jgi:[ribosomal protein S5]-alanine N-acetyltransferase
LPEFQPASSTASILPFGAALPSTTARLVLRRFAANDLARFQAYRRDPDVGRYQVWSAQDDDHAAHFLDSMAAAKLGVPGEWFQIAIGDRHTNLLIGDIGICIRGDGRAEIGFTIAPSAQRNGHGTEAVRAALTLLFGTGEIEHVVGIADVRNTSSIRLLQRVGMRMVRTQTATCKGETCQENVYRIDKSRPG